ncbi:MAG: hypothetical protein ACRDUA_05980, partial [Micromonosporaceae bacterium]
LMSIKLAACRVPLGGAKAVAVPRLSADRQALLGEIATALAPHLRTRYVLGEDLGTTGADVVAIYQHIGLDPVRFVTEHNAARGIRLDVPDGLGLGDLMNDEFAGILAGSGAVQALAAALEARGEKPDGLRAAVQGFGTVGLAAARALVESGVTVVTVADADGVLHDPVGLDVEALAAARTTDGLVDRGALGSVPQRHDRDRWCELPAEVLVPAAVARVIREDNVAAVTDQARYLVEGANAPVTDGAERELERRGVTVLPDFIANAGSAVAFGLLIAGEATVATVLETYVARIRQAVRGCLASAGSGPDGGSSRDRATAIAREFLDQHPS